MDLEQASAVIITMDEPVAAHRIVKRLRARSPDLPIIARARDAGHAAALYRAGATHAVPETLESSLQLSEAVLVDLGVPMGPVIVSIHEKRDELRASDHGRRRTRGTPQAQKRKHAGTRATLRELTVRIRRQAMTKQTTTPRDEKKPARQTGEDKGAIKKPQQTDATMAEKDLTRGSEPATHQGKQG